MKIYVASSWRNTFQEKVVSKLSALGYEVYDFKKPWGKDDGFHWSEIDKEWKTWPGDKFKNALSHPVAERGFEDDFAAMRWADVFVLVLPCGRSAHLEAGWAIGAGKPTYFLLEGEDKPEPELMYKLAEDTTVNPVCVSLKELCLKLKATSGKGMV